MVDHDVHNIHVQNAKVWWWYQLPCAPASQPQGTYRVEEISRIATTGSLTRTLYAHEVPDTGCPSWSNEIRSNVVADDNYLYWMSDEYNGLVRLSVEANEGDEAELRYSGQSSAAEIEERGNYLYLMSQNYGIIRVNKSTGASNTIINSSTVGTNPSNLQVSNEYLFWRNSNYGFVVANFGGQGSGYPNVSEFVAENSLCPVGGSCPTTEYVFVVVNDTIYRYNVDTGNAGSALYTIPVSNASIIDMTVDGSKLYWFEERAVICNPFCSYNYSLWRMNRTGGTAELLYLSPTSGFGESSTDLTLGGPTNNYLFWTDEGELKRLPKDAAAIPVVDVDITAVEVSQAIQDLNQTIPLIQGKRTGVRVHIDAAGQNVAGITAYLYRINGSGTVLDGPIYPSGGTTFLTAQNSPDRATFDHAFYFELPIEWVQGSSVRVRAEINPVQVPPEPNYSNNIQNSATLSLSGSPTLKTHLIVWGYTVEDSYYQPDTYQDVYQARSWIRRTYPLASYGGDYDAPLPGFRLAVRTINDPELGDYVMRIADDCLDMDEDDISKCAAAYTNSYAKSLRVSEGLPDDELIYSMIFSDPDLEFPRGFASDGVSAGPTGSNTWGWDNDGSYGDWYMGHEVGHNVGRPHPDDLNADDLATNDVLEGCGHSPSDPNFPYDFTEIGLGDMWGLDVGDVGLNGDLDPRVYPNDIWTDMMGYCSNQWISDYTYNLIYDFLTSRAAASDPAPARAGEGYIALFGTIDADETPSANFQVVGLWDSPGPYGLPTGSDYQMRFLDSTNSVIATHAVDADEEDGGGSLLGFHVVVPFPLNTRTIQLVQAGNGAILASHLISANAPTISNVALVAPSNPVTGTQTLQWLANDSDGDSLRYDLFYSPDGGTTMTAFAVGVQGNSLLVDTTQLPGAPNGTFRVVANDGTRQSEATSPAYTVANKPPLVTFMFPQEGLEVRYGTQVNFGIEVENLQGYVPENNISWRLNGLPVVGASGSFLTMELLPVGTNTITARVVNAQGQVTLKNITVIVNDDVDYPGATLAVGPTQLGWHVGTRTTAIQQATLAVSNVGTGSLQWSATESAPWLSLSSSSGTNNGTIIVSADPALVTAGTPATTVITLSGNNGQTLEIPVSLMVGVSPVWFPPEPPPGPSPTPTATATATLPPQPNNLLYLPLIRRD